ncbi:MAG: 30S ribosomal protein S2 [Anaerolineales bacterium]|nr:30S ribosomal protein S2 [Anaerolineales bacterium]
MAIISMKALLESGVHFGHRTNKWDPHMKPYIFTERNGIHIIDLQKTVKLLTQAYNLVRDTVNEGGTILFVGTKRQAQETIAEEANRCGMPYVNERWLGGTLTNWSTIQQRIQELERLEGLYKSGEINRLTKKEGLMIDRSIRRLEKRLSGVRNMKLVPNLLFVIDILREDAAVHEANLLNIPVVAMVDTNCDPRNIDYVIPSNDDAIRAINLLVGKIADAVLEGKALRKDEEQVEDEKVDLPVGAAAQAGVSVSLDDEPEEEDLLGEATLAKLTSSRKEAEVEAEKAAAAEKAASEEAGEEAEEQKPETKAKTAPKAEPAAEEEPPAAEEKPKAEAVKKPDEEAEEKPKAKAAKKPDEEAEEKPKAKAAKKPDEEAEEKPKAKAAKKADEEAEEKTKAKAAKKTVEKEEKEADKSEAKGAKKTAKKKEDAADKKEK